jgi:hypothetical protein
MDSEPMFRLLFERADAIVLFEPHAVFVINEAAVKLMRSNRKNCSGRNSTCRHPFQPDGRSSRKSRRITSLASTARSYRFEWVARRMDGEAVPLES